MRVARITQPDGPAYGLIRDEAVHLIDSDPFTDFVETGVVVPLAQARLLAPVEPSKILCVGRNYAAHIKEMGYEPGAEPTVFLKPPTAITGPHGVVVLPPTNLSSEVEHEAELGVVISRPARSVSVGDALSHVFGYTCANDVSARDLQRRDNTLVRAKGFDTFCPVGPWIETDPDVAAGLVVTCRVNGELRQRGNTSDLVFSLPFLISYISQFTTLLPGDLVLTGSPGGSGPMRDGDTVEIEVSDVGTLSHTVAASVR